MMSSQIEKSARKNNKYIDLDTTRVSIGGETLKKFSIFDRNTPGISKIDGGPSFMTTEGNMMTLQDASTFRDESKLITERPLDNSNLKKALN